MGTELRHNGVLLTLLTGSAVLAGCSTPCATGFSRDAEGICHAIEACRTGTARGTDLACHTIEEQNETAIESDTGDWSAGDPTDPTAPSPDEDTGAPTEGPGRIWVSYEQLEGVPLHGFVVFGNKMGNPEPVASFCQIILSDPMTVQGYLVPFSGTQDPCPSTGEPSLFDPGEVTLIMTLSTGFGSEPVLCDERRVTIAGDQMVDFSDVITCDS